MSTEAVVRVWHGDKGWGVIDSADTPGGCWAHFSAVAVDGFAALEAGQAVELEWETVEQDGFATRATRVWPAGQAPVDHAPDEPDNETFLPGAYSSSLTITFDD